MDINISLSDLESAARDIVRRQMLEGDLDSLTKGNVRKRVEQRFSLGPGTLSVKEYKHPLNIAIQTAVDEFEEEEERGDEECILPEHPARRTKVGKQVTQRPKSTANIHPKKRRAESSRAYKSAAYVAGSDVEDEVVMLVKEDDIKSDLLPQKRRKVDAIEVEAQLKIDAPPLKLTKANDSESDISILVDEAPKRRNKVKGSTQEKDGKKNKLNTEQKGRNAPQELSRDEATIKRLKSFVTACGMRRPWVKLLEGCDTPSQQIKKLKETLAELGMSGRMSIDQAKKIKAKRELAKELEEVQSFAQPILGRPSRRKIKSKFQGEESEPEGEESEEDMIPAKRNRRSALLSITAFLDDQSDDD